MSVGEFALEHDRVRFAEPPWAAEGTVDLDGTRVRLGRPRVVVESVDRCWYPDLLRFSTGELMLSYSLNEDSNYVPVTGQAVLISTDGGMTWGTDHPEYDVNGFHNGNGEIRWATNDGAIVGIGAFVRPVPSGQMRRFAVHRWRYERGGRCYAVEPWGAVIEGFQRDVRPYGAAADARNAKRSRWQFASLNPFGEAVDLVDGGVGSPVSLRYEGDRMESTVFIVTHDQGLTWQVRATIADQDSVPGANEGFDEACVVRLADERLLCVSRVGDSQALAKSYSSDDGYTWTKPTRMAAWSVAPTVRRLANGTLVLTTGRPGVYLWICTDGIGETWHPIEIAEGYHNAVVPPSQRILHPERPGPSEHRRFQTSAYVATLEVEPDHLLMAYDRAPFGWAGPARDRDPQEVGQIFLLDVWVGRPAGRTT